MIIRIPVTVDPGGRVKIVVEPSGSATVCTGQDIPRQCMLMRLTLTLVSPHVILVKMGAMSSSYRALFAYQFKTI